VWARKWALIARGYTYGSKHAERVRVACDITGGVAPE
jgi:hypothetical protein